MKTNEYRSDHGFNRGKRPQVVLRADFSYAIHGNVISIVDLDLGNRSVTNDIENVLRRIEHDHQGSIADALIIYRDSQGVRDGVEWDGKEAHFLPLGEPSEEEARRKLCSR
jgi:hypothetical protein